MTLHTQRERGGGGISCQKPRLRAKVFEDSGRDKSTRRYIPVSSRIDSNELFESFSIDYYTSCRISIKQLCLPRYTNQEDNPLLFQLRCFQRSHSNYPYTVGSITPTRVFVLFADLKRNYLERVSLK